MSAHEKPDINSLSARDFMALKHGADTKAWYFEAPTKPKTPAALPRTIHMLWDTGFERAPEVVQTCLKSWQHLNPGWRFNLMDAAAAHAVVDPASFARSPAMAGYSDILRTELLRREGGVWVDATVLCLKPLDDWLLPYFNQSDFFAFSRPGRDRILASWLLAAVPDHPLITGWSDLIRAFWAEADDSPRPYYWAHYLFEYMIRSARPQRRLWNALPRISAEPQVKLAYFLTGQLGEQSSGDGLTERLRHTPVQKLTHKKRIPMNALALEVSRIDPDLARALF